MDRIHGAVGLPVGPRYLYVYLRDYAYETHGADFPTHEQIASDLGVSRFTIMRWLEMLEIAGFIHVNQRGCGLPNHYDILDPGA